MTQVRNTSGLRRGGPGRPKGSKNKKTKAIQEWARGLLDSKKYRDQLEDRLCTGKVAPGVEALVWQYGYGKPPDQLQVSLEDRRVIHVLPPDTLPEPIGQTGTYVRTGTLGGIGQGGVRASLPPSASTSADVYADTSGG